jgi:hypothetical protein
LIIGDVVVDDALEGNGDTAGGAFDNELRTALKFKGVAIWTNVIAKSLKKHVKGFFLPQFVVIGTI